MELGSSAATLVSSSPLDDVKIKRSKKVYLVVVGLLILAVIFVIATGLLVDQVVRSKKQLVSVQEELRETKKAELPDQEEEKVCWTKECILSASSIIESMDESADPCEDFQQFACGGWKEKNAIPWGHGELSHFDKLSGRIDQFNEKFFKDSSSSTDSKPVNNTRDLYRACIDTDSIEKLGITALIDLLDSYGKWPMTTTDWNEDRFDWRKATASIRNTFGVGLLFSVINFFDVLDNEMSVIYIDQPYIWPPDFLFKRANLTDFAMVAYSTFISKVAFIIRDSIGGKADNETIIKDTEDVISFHIALTNILTPNEERWSANISRFYNEFLLPDLQDLTDAANTTNPISQIDWRKHLNDIYSVSDISIHHDERIIVIEPDYLQRLVELLDQTPPRVIANFVHWQLVLRNIFDFNSVMFECGTEFFEAIFGEGSLFTREDWCWYETYQMMGFAIGSKFIEKNFDPLAKIEVEEMVLDLKVAFSSLVEESDWMDQETKINALEKAAEMKAYVGYPDWIANRTTLELAYRGIETRPDTHFANFMSVKRFMIANSLRFLRFRTDRENYWISFPAVVNAYYLPMLNTITFPAGILQPPFYGRGRLAASNYGGIGAIIGHEITHGFDNSGSLTDKRGHERSWWTNQTREEFNNRKQCIVDQYSNMSVPELIGVFGEKNLTLHINGTRSQGENIADNGGIRQAFRAYQNYVARHGREPRLPGLERYTPEQIFFLSFANIWCENIKPEQLANRVLFGVHSPSRYRILGTLSNSADFAQHFNCPVGSKMNRPNQCTVW